MRAAADNALKALIDEFKLRFASLLYDFEHKAAQLGHEKWCHGYQHGYCERDSEIRHNDERAAGPESGVALEETFK